jgi:hypothetical protein
VGGDVNTTLPLILNIVGLFCCLPSVISIIGLVFTILAINVKGTNPDDARGKAKIGLILGIVSLALGAIGWIVYFLLFGFAMVMDG